MGSALARLIKYMGQRKKLALMASGEGHESTNWQWSDREPDLTSSESTFKIAMINSGCQEM
jgi:hypothetical protein